MKNRFGTDPLTYLEKEIGRMCRVGVLEIADGCIRPTKTGRFFSDEISVGFYSFAVKEKLV